MTEKDADLKEARRIMGNLARSPHKPHDAPKPNRQSTQGKKAKPRSKQNRGR